MYSASAFVLSSFTVDVLILWVFSLIATCIYFWMLHYTNEAWRFFVLVTDVFLATMVMEQTLHVIVFLTGSEVSLFLFLSFVLLL